MKASQIIILISILAFFYGGIGLLKLFAYLQYKKKEKKDKKKDN